MIPGSANPLLLASAAAAPTGYQISRSVRFNPTDSAFLSRTPSVAGNRKTWTWAGWAKRSALNTNGLLFNAGPRSSSGNATGLVYLQFGGDTLAFILWTSASTNVQLTTTAVYRDPSAWYHIIAVLDTDNATSTDRLRLYVNGERIVAFNNASYPSLGATFSVSDATFHEIGRYVWAQDQYFPGYLADIHFIDGQALDPSSFGEFDANGVWQPKAYTGTYGTNGFHLPFSDNSTAAALGTDTSGNSNNFTVNNISVTAGAGNDSLVDTPTSYGVDDGLGGSVRGNYATLNPLAKGVYGSQITFSNGNLDAVWSATAGYTVAIASFGLSSAKWYWEIGDNATARLMVGVLKSSGSLDDYIGTTGPAYDSVGYTWLNAAFTSGFPTFTSGDIIGIALDLDNGKIWFAKNGTWLNSGNPSSGVNPAYSSLTGTYFPAISEGDGNAAISVSANFGQRPFAYPAPSGFKALCTTNLPEPVVAKPSTAMDVKLYTGNGSTQTISGLGFSPDLAWIKCRSEGSTNPAIWDVVRGPGTSNLDTNRLSTNNTNAEEANDIYGYVSAFNSDGITVEKGSTTTVSNTNRSGQTYVAWCWDAGSSTVTNTQGSITSQVRASASSGFSVVTYSGNNTTTPSPMPTVGHGLNIAPSLIISKSRNNSGVDSGNWFVWHSGAGTGNWLRLNTTDAAASISASGGGGMVAPTGTVFSTPYISGSNISGNDYVAYCFAPVAGYSNGFSYTGNGSTDGSFVYLGFRPRLILLKCSSTTGNWTLLDTAREGYNVDNDPLYPNLSNAEGTTDLLDITSNGFKLRTTDASVNSSGATYVGYAWAEAPFAYSRAR